MQSDQPLDADAATAPIRARPAQRLRLVWHVRELAEGIGWDVRELHRQSGVYRESLDRIWLGTSKQVGLGTMERLRAALGLDHVGQLFTYTTDAPATHHERTPS